MFFNSNNNSKKQTKQEVLEIDYVKENKILQEIIRVSYSTKDIIEACNKIVRIITSNYNMDYCTLFLVNDDTFKVAGTNIPYDMTKSIEEFANVIYREKCQGKEADAYVLKSQQPINYETGWQREIRYMMFSPLKIDGLIGGILLENTNLNIAKDEMEFFELIVENVALILQNLIYFKKIVDAANKDGLTGVYNRHYMNEHLQSMIDQNLANGRRFCIALFDIDHFKNFNDTYGHLHGDKVLKEVSKFIQNSIRACDCLYRYGGEEFIINFANIGVDDAAELLDRLRQGVSELQITTEANEVTQVTASFGVTEFPTHDQSVKGLVEKADKAMYVSKETGRNRVTKYSAEVEAQAPDQK